MPFLLIHHIPELGQIRIQDDLNAAVQGSAFFGIITGNRVVFASASGK
jgi:hypothetical protein